MTVFVQETPYWIWIPTVSVATILFAIAFHILLRERQKRLDVERIIVSKYLSSFSFLCIATCPLYYMCVFCMYFNITCFIAIPLRYITSIGQVSAMSFFQLSRLYYCFSQQKAHSDQGYPKWVFILMFCGVFVWFISWNTLLLTWPKQCGIARDGSASMTFKQHLNAEDSALWDMILVAFSVAIDLMTVLLYWCKIRSFKRYQTDKNRDVYRRILFILHRMLILTYFYLIAVAWSVLFYRLLSMRQPLWFIPLFYSMAMYLMMDHNTAAYMTFLRLIKKFKMYFCCCCCFRMVRDQHQLIVDNVDERKAPEPTTNTWDTQNISNGDEYAIKGTGMELSIATKTECNVVHVDVEIENKDTKSGRATHLNV